MQDILPFSYWKQRQYYGKKAVFVPWLTPKSLNLSSVSEKNCNKNKYHQQNNF